jgi:hypothetical protein
MKKQIIYVAVWKTVVQKWKLKEKVNKIGFMKQE